jgi:hypothetical protein
LENVDSLEYDRNFNMPTDNPFLIYVITSMIYTLFRYKSVRRSFELTVVSSSMVLTSSMLFTNRSTIRSIISLFASFLIIYYLDAKHAHNWKWSSKGGLYQRSRMAKMTIFNLILLAVSLLIFN